ncbi:MAG: dihydrofolate reductase [Flavobacteriales bacterium]|nr:dihydrofolate reductase [Flavobacteriales bacterium]
MKISLIVAASENNVIGRDNDLPWKLPNDMKFFVKTTKGHHILMGRKNLESFGRLLPNRTNILLTRDQEYKFDGAEIFFDLQKAIDFAKQNGENELMIIGGGEIYRQSMPFADHIYLTRVHAEIEGDVYFPELDPAIWELKSEKFHDKDEKHNYAFSFQSYQRIK